MFRRGSSLGSLRPGVLALLMLCGAALPAPAQAFYLRNDCRAPIVVQVSFLSRGVFRRDRPYLLNFGEATPSINLPGDKIIVVYDAKMPNRILFQGTPPAAPRGQYFRIVPHRVAGRVNIEVLPPPRRRP